MYKFKTTRKTLVNMFPDTIRLGYCSAQFLLYYQSPIAYTCGVYGWNFDFYNVNGKGISTGYRGMFGKKVSYELTREYEKKAEMIVNDYKMPYEERRERVNNLLSEYIGKALEG